MSKSTIIHCFVNELTPRVEFAFDFIFKQVMGLDYLLFDNLKNYSERDGFGVIYGKEHINTKGFFIQATNLLFDDRINTSLQVEVAIIDHLPGFFKVSESDFPIDLPSCVFYLLSRYEEYYDVALDTHGRYPSENSLAVQHDFLEMPLLDIWISRLAMKLEEHYPSLSIPFLHDKKRRAEIEFTFDIDFPWAYQHRPILHNIGGALKDLFRGDKLGCRKRLSVMLGKHRDPYDQYHFIKTALAKHSIVPRFFMLMRDRTIYDRNHYLHHRKFKALIQELSLWADIGIHPSYNVSQDEMLLKEEMETLSEISSIKMNTSRMHFLKFELPHTYRLLLKNGINTDYTMGYAERMGFRSSTSYCHKWFDLEKNEISKLNIIPLIVMDTTLHTYLGLSPKNAIYKIKEMMDWVMEMKGNSTILWHNNSLSDWNQWKDWRAVFLTTLEYYVDKR